ncbi:hypothetical protein B0T19DRAFT_429453 [Cercophora scortea]|uniref:Uncharacterized protein n=1 Tax=Cercophora scortea TaxID=314031 RepID=A0AAE0IGW4_9PEZI|nr:hypothetical protein B0T19DRAFT_429453 [Cercophora scortea]
MNDDPTHRWTRHLAAVQDDLSATSTQAVLSLAGSADEGRTTGDGAIHHTQIGHIWDEKMDSVVEALQELTVQSPTNTTATRSPETPWFPDRDRETETYTDTAASSPHESNWSRTVAPPMKQKRHSHYADYIDGGRLERNLVEFSTPHDKGKGLADDTTKSDNKTQLNHNYWHTALLPHISYQPPDEPETATLLRGPHRPQNPPPQEVHVLILTWVQPSHRGDDGQILKHGSLDTETDTLRACFKRRGYRVQCRLIPEDYPTAAVATMLDRFLAKSKPDSLLVVYYHGYGCSRESDGSMIFSSRTGENHFTWPDIRDPIMETEGDVLLIFDCTSPPGYAPEMCVDAGLALSPTSTKQILGVCTPISETLLTSTKTATPGRMTQALCTVLDRDAASGPDHADGDSEAVTVQRVCSHIKGEMGGEKSKGVFVTQLGGGQIMDVYLPILSLEGGAGVGI